MDGNSNLKDFLVEAVTIIEATGVNEVKFNLSIANDNQNIDVSFLLHVTEINGEAINNGIIKGLEND